MRLKRLFSENDKPGQIAKSQELIRILKDLQWTINVAGQYKVVSGYSNDLKALAIDMKNEGAQKIKTTDNNFDRAGMIMLVDVGRHYNNHYFEELRSIFHPEIDVPKPEATEVGFHDQDEFGDNEPMINDYEFVINNDPTDPQQVSCVVGIADTREDVELPIPVQHWLVKFQEQIVNQINSLL